MTDVTRNATAASDPAPAQRWFATGATGEAPAGSEHRVLITDRQSDVDLDAERYGVLVQRVLDAEGAPPGSETAVTFVGASEMARLNAAHMGHDGPTDVLAFPLDLAAAEQAPSDPATATVLVGDVVVCPAVAAANAPAALGSRDGHDGSVRAEIDLLVVHGVLHLLGMDHAEPHEAADMRAREVGHLRGWWSRK